MMSLLKNSFTMQVPQFQEDEPYARFIKRFKVFLIRDSDCNFALNGEQPPQDIDRLPSEKDSSFFHRVRENETKKEKFENGKAKIFSNLYFAVCETNSRATNRLHTSENQDGLEALKELEDEYADEAVIKEDALNLKLLYDNRKIQSGEKVTHFLEEITKLRLRLSHLKIHLSDDEIVWKLIHGMTTPQNQKYQQVQISFLTNGRSLSLSELTSSLRKIDSIMNQESTEETISPPQTIISQPIVTQTPTPISETVNLTNSESRDRRDRHEKGSFKRKNKDKNWDIDNPPRKSRNDNCRRCGGRFHKAENCKKNWDEIRRHQAKKNEVDRQPERSSRNEDEGDDSDFSP